MSDVDAILASGVYVDRRGSRWERTDQGGYTQWWSEDEWPCIEHADMRRLIVREQHREACPGLKRCYKHPVPHVVRVGRPGGRVFAIYGSPDGQAQPDQDTLAEAIDAAQQLAKETTHDTDA